MVQLFVPRIYFPCLSFIFGELHHQVDQCIALPMGFGRAACNSIALRAMHTAFAPLAAAPPRLSSFVALVGPARRWTRSLRPSTACPRGPTLCRSACPFARGFPLREWVVRLERSSRCLEGLKESPQEVLWWKCWWNLSGQCSACQPSCWGSVSAGASLPGRLTSQPKFPTGH